MDQPRHPQPRFGNYELLSQLGKGGMAEVFRARVISGPRQGWMVAIKRLLPELSKDPDYVSLFASEADLSRFLDHPNIVKVLEVGILDDIYFMVMDLVDGRDLGKILRRCKERGIPLPIDFAVYLAKVLLDSLDYAHGAVGPHGTPLGIVHCDVSPSNIFISRTGEIKLGDFGIARARAGAMDPNLLGKPYYLSPEVLEGEIKIDADLWSATVVLYELLTLERPFTGKTPDEVFTGIRGRLYTPVSILRPEVSTALQDIIERGFNTDRSERFRNAAEFAQALESHYDDSVGTPLGIASVVRGLFGASAD